MFKKILSRRRALMVGLSGLATPVMAQVDRPEVKSARSWFGFFERPISCDNSGVPKSALATRLSKVEDFSAVGNCQLTTDDFEGPFFTCVNPGGKQIAGDRPGQALTVAIRVQDKNCQPVENVTVDIWACDAQGIYSGYDPNLEDEQVEIGGHVLPQNDLRFCRGALLTDKDGIAEFDTIYPGYYEGRAIHIHFKLHDANNAYATSQALMPESSNDVVMLRPPYNEPRTSARVLNSEDGDGLPEFRIQERNQRMLATLLVSAST